MAEAQKYNGVALVGYVDGKPVDSNGVEVEGAPAEPKSTDPSQQPHGMAALNSEERSAAILANALATALGKTPPNALSAPADASGLPTVADLDDHLASIKSVAEVKALQKQDDRVTAEPKYAKRIAELEAE